MQCSPRLKLAKGSIDCFRTTRSESYKPNKINVPWIRTEDDCLSLALIRKPKKKHIKYSYQDVSTHDTNNHR